MAGRLVVMVGYITTPNETHPLITFLADAEDQKQFSSFVQHRDMNQVRSYYNGLLDGWNLVKAGGVHRTIELTVIGKYPLGHREFHQPSIFGPEDYMIADSVPAHLR